VRWCRGALAELEPGDQEIVELHLRHEFYGADLADALGGAAQSGCTRSPAGPGPGSRTALGRARGGPLPPGILPGSVRDPGGVETGTSPPNLRRQVSPAHRPPVRSAGEHERRHVKPGSDAERGCRIPSSRRAFSTRRSACSRIPLPMRPRSGPRSRTAPKPFTRSGFPVPLDPLASRRGAGCVRAGCRGYWSRVFVMFGGRGHARSELTASHVAPGQFSALAPSVPSADAGARGEHAPSPRHRGTRRAHGKHGAAAASGTGSYTPGAGKSGKVLQAGQPPVLGEPLEVRAHLPSVHERRADPPSFHADDANADTHADGYDPRRPAGAPSGRLFSGRSSAGCRPGRPAKGRLEQAALSQARHDQVTAVIATGSHLVRPADFRGVVETLASARSRAAAIRSETSLPNAASPGQVFHCRSPGPARSAPRGTYFSARAGPGRRSRPGSPPSRHPG